MFGNFTFGSPTFALPDFEKIVLPAPPAPKGGGPWQNWNWLEHPLRKIEASGVLAIDAEAECAAIGAIEARCIIRFKSSVEMRGRHLVKASATINLSAECSRLSVKLLPPKVRHIRTVKFSQGRQEFGEITFDSPQHDPEDALLLALIDDL